MKIEPGQIQQGLLDVGQREQAGATDKATGDTQQANRAGDEVALSARLRQIRELAGEVGDVRSVDRDLVAALRGQIAAGEYAPTSDTIAAALARALRGGDL